MKAQVYECAAREEEGEAGRKPIEPDASCLGNWKYTQAKEVTVICHAIEGPTFTGTDEGAFTNKREYTELTSAAKMADFKGGMDFREDKQVLGYLKYLMGQFLHSFKL